MSSTPSPIPTDSQHDGDPGLHQENLSIENATDSEEEDDEDRSEGSENTRNESKKEKDCNELRTPTKRTAADEDDNDSVWSRETSPANEPLQTPLQLSVPTLGLSRRFGYSDYDDLDVVTVHGLRDDHQTAWTSSIDSSHWIQSKLFSYASIRHLDYVYDTGDSARVYGPNGINMEANALLASLAQERTQLLDTERDRPIVWICHDLGSSIVKQALINAIFNQPQVESEDDPERLTCLRNVYRRLPSLTSAMIFLGCPQGNESKEALEDQLFALFCLPGPHVRTKILQKISALASQINKTNLEFLETNILDRAVILNITSAPKEQGQTDAACESEKGQQPTVAQGTVDEQTANTPKSSRQLFPIHARCFPHKLGIFYTAWWDTTDHAGLVRNDDSSGLDWASSYHFQFWDKSPGWNFRNDSSFFAYQNSLLSLSSPTQVNECRCENGGSKWPALIDWVIGHSVFDREIHQHPGMGIVYIHGGSRQAVDMKFLSQQLSIGYDVVRNDQRAKAPDYGCFYYEFDRHDSRRSSIKAMIVSFVCTYAGRFWANADDVLEWFPKYMGRFNCWSLKDLLHVFLRVQQIDGMKCMPIILGQFDQCDEEERLIFLQAMIKRQERTELRLQLLITTARPEGFISGMMPPDSIISLDECPLSLDDFLVCPNPPGAAEARMQILLARRPEFAHLGPSLHEVFEKFRGVPSLQDAVRQWLGVYKRGCSADEATDIIQELSSDAHKILLRSLIDQLSVEKQRVVVHIYNWIQYAAEPLTLEILAEAVRYSLPPGMAELQQIKDNEEFGKFVEQNLGGIVLRVGRDFRFSDDSFYEISATVESCGEQEHACRSHSDMATTCLRYLLGSEGQKMLASLSVENQGMDDPSWSPIMLPRHSLVSYALRFWTLHYQKSGDYRPIDLATELLQDHLKRNIWAEAVYVVSNPFMRSNKGYMSPLPYMAMFGLDDLVTRQIESEASQGSWNQDHWLAIAEAARNGHGTTVALLLEHTDMDAAGLGEALRWAANYGEGGALDCLVSKAQEIEQYQWPPFIIDRAVVAGLERLVSALVDSGYDMNEEIPTMNDRAVHNAIRYGHDRVLKILLDSGRADLGFRHDSDLSTQVWTLAAEAGNTASIQHMLDAGVGFDNFEEAANMLLWTVGWANHGALRMLFDAQVFSKDHINSKATTDGYGYHFSLEQAAKHGLRACTRILLDNGADPNAASEDGGALYQVLASIQDPPTCLILLEKGADPNQSAADDPANDGKATRLMQAINSGSKVLVEMLLDHDAKINVADPAYYEYYECDTPLTRAIERGHVDIVRLVLERGADVNLVSEDKKSPLFEAAFVRSPEMVESLIKHGANTQWTRSSDGWSVLHAAYDSADTMSALLQNGVDINLTDSQNWTALMLAARYNFPQSVELLLKQTDPKADLEIMTTDEPTATALHLACQNGQTDTAKLLLEAGAAINGQESGGDFPLGRILASDVLPSACEDMVDFMLKRKSDLGLADTEGNSVLHNIKSDTPLSVVMRLVEEGAPVNTFNDSGYNPLARAVSCGNNAVARYLTTVKGSQTSVYHPSFGSIIHLAVASSSLDVVKQLVRTGAELSIVDPGSGEPVLYSALGNVDKQERRKIIRYLVEEVGVDINAPGGKWGYPLLRLASSENVDKSLLKYLLRRGAHPDNVDSAGRTAVHLAIIRDRYESDWIDLLKILFKSGANFAVADNYGRTPLHFAAAMCPPDVVRYIIDSLSSGSEASHVEALDVDGWTPLMWASRGGRSDAAEILVNEYKADIHVRSKDLEWSPWKIARHRDWPYNWAEALLVPDNDALDDGDSRESQYHQVESGRYRWLYCVGCELPICGQAWICPICTDHLCFKCIRHSGTMHNPEHTFVDLDEYQNEQAGSLVEANKSGHGGESQNGSDNEEQDEDDTESEEEEDDDSE